MTSAQAHWWFQVAGRAEDLAAVEGMARECGWRSRREEGALYVGGNELDSLTDYDEALAEARHGFAILSGVTRMRRGNCLPVAVTGAAFRGEGADRNVWVQPARIESRVEVGEVTVIVDGQPPAEPWWKSAVRIARHQPEVSQVIGLYATQPDGPSMLWHVAELIAADLSPTGSRNLGALSAYAPPAEIDRFKDSVNHPAVYGASSRHGVPRNPVPPAQPMLLKEATEFVVAIMRRWIETKV